MNQRLDDFQTQMVDALEACKQMGDHRLHDLTYREYQQRYQELVNAGYFTMMPAPAPEPRLSLIVRVINLFRPFARRVRKLLNRAK